MTLWILLGYECKSYNGSMSRDAWLDRLAAHFRSVLVDLKTEAAFWEKIDSAQQYGLVAVSFDIDAGLRNLRELVQRCEALGAAH